MKKIILILITFLILITNINALELNTKYSYIYNLTDDIVIYEENAHEEILVASMTKIMTAIIVIENNNNLDKEISITDEDLRDMYDYTTTGFERGDKVSIKELLYGILLVSGADSVNAAVRATTKTEEEFIDLMNQKVKELNLKNTYFSNPVGKDKGNYSSCYDIAKIMEYCLKNKTFKEIISTKMYYIEDLDVQINGPLYKVENKFGVDLSLVNGGKTGYTPLARNSFVSYSERDNITYISVIADVKNYKTLLEDTKYIYEYLYDNYSYKDYNINFDVDIENGIDKKYNINLDTKLFLKNDIDTNLITYAYDGVDSINILKRKGDKLGKVSIYYDDNLIKEENIYLNKNIEFKSKNIIKIVLIIISIIISLLFIFKLLKRKNKKIKKEEKIVQVNKIVVEEDINKKIEILNNTVNVNLFFSTLKNIKKDIDKETLEHDFIDRCFKNIDFKNIEDLKDLYTKLKLYKSEMCTKTIKYYNKLFKYCIEKYVDKVEKG